MNAKKYTDDQHHAACDSWFNVADEIWTERLRQLEKWGIQRHPDGTGSDQAAVMSAIINEGHGATYGRIAAKLKQTCDDRHDADLDEWALILLEEVFEALAEGDHAKLRAELVQVAAVAFAWIDDLDSREAS